MMLAVMGAYQARRDVTRTQTTTAIMAVANLLFIVFLVATSGDIWIFALSALVKPLVGIVCFARIMKSELRVISFAFDRKILADYVAFAVPLLPMSVLAVIYDKIDGTLVANFLSYRDNGFLTAATMFNTLLLVPSTSMMTLLYSSFSEELSKDNRVRVQEISRRATKYLSMVVSLLSMFLFFYTEPVVLVAMSREYLPAVPIIRVFMFQVVLMSVSRTFGSIMLASEQLRIANRVGVCLALLGIVLDFIFIPPSLFGVPMMGLGATGPAYKSLIVYIVSIITTGILLKKLLNITIYWRFVLHMVAAVAAGWLLAVFLPAATGVTGLIGAFAAFTIVYVLFLMLFREIGAVDLEYGARALAVWRGGVT
jgi:O-antigen/teichoic acid export membrane protein